MGTDCFYVDRLNLKIILHRHRLEIQMLHERIGSRMANGATNNLSDMSPTNEDFCDALSSVSHPRVKWIYFKCDFCSLTWRERILSPSQP
jgi:hypothetical protein